MAASPKNLPQLVTDPPEPYYSPKEVAKRLSVSRDTAIRLFQNEPGVLILESRAKPGKRRSPRLIRIPASAVERVIQRLSR